MAREVKELIVKELTETFRDINDTGCVLVSYRGMKAREAHRLRQEVRQLGGRLTAVKNSLFALALDRLGAAELKGLLEGPIAVVQSETSVDAAKVAQEMTKLCAAIQVRGAYVDGTVVSPQKVEELARIPSREVLLGMVAGALMGPLRRLASALMAKPRALVSALDQLRARSAQKEVA